jgi:hypothetical protein
MGLTKEQKENVKQVLKSSLRNKFQNYNPEPASMPFHTRLLGKDRLALYSFIQSLVTNFGTTVFEPVAVTIAQNNYKSARSHIVSGKVIFGDAVLEIQKIMEQIRSSSGVGPNKITEIEAIRKVCQSGEKRPFKPTVVDLAIQGHDDKLYLFDIKTAKPNAGGFLEFKRTLLEWVAVVLAEDPKIDVNTYIAIPYNPYEPKEYSRWTMRGTLDLQNELKVGDVFWDFLGGQGTYGELLDCFEQVGIELRDEIDEYFARFNK